MSIVKRVELQWQGRGQVFKGWGEEGEAIVIDGDREEGQGPMEVLLLSVAACMAIDVLMILERSRVPVNDLSVVVEGQRNEDHPRRYNAIQIIYRLAGPGEEHQRRLDRAVSLSRDKYCSVIHSLRTDIDIDVRVERA